jgi:hypothetical protein
MPGEIIAREGAVGRHVYLVMSGMVSVLLRQVRACAARYCCLRICVPVPIIVSLYILCVWRLCC